MRIDPVGHEGCDGARRIIFASVAGRLKVVEKLLIELAEVPPLIEIVEIDLVDLVHHLPQQLTGFHVIVGVLKHVAHHATAVARFIIDEIEQRLPRNAFRVRCPVAPLEFFRDRRAVAVLGQFEFLILIIDDFEEEHPRELADALRIAIDAHVLAHDVLNGFNCSSNDHWLGCLLVERVLQLVDGLFKALLAAERLDELNDAAHRSEGRDL